MLTAEILNVLARKWRIDIIRTLKAYPDRDFTVNELSRASKAPVMTSWRAVKELKKAGLVRTRRVGNALAVSLTDDRERLKLIRMIAGTDPQRAATKLYASRLSENDWLIECRLFGSIGRGEHLPGEEVDVAVIYDESEVEEGAAKQAARKVAQEVRAETNVDIVPMCVTASEMSRKGGLAAELRDRESIWKR